MYISILLTLILLTFIAFFAFITAAFVVIRFTWE